MSHCCVQVDLFAPALAKEKVQIGDCLWLYHIEDECFLDNDAMTVMPTDTPEGLLERLQLVQLQKVQGLGEADCLGWSATGLWEIEGENCQRGGTVEYSKVHRLRHLCSKQYLSLKHDPRRDTWDAVLRADPAGGECDFQFVSASSQKSSVISCCEQCLRESQLLL